MDTIISTMKGTYIVPSNKFDDLVLWLEKNGIKPNHIPVREIKEDQYTGRQLINE